MWGAEVLPFCGSPVVVGVSKNSEFITVKLTSQTLLGARRKGGYGEYENRFFMRFFALDAGNGS